MEKKPSQMTLAEILSYKWPKRPANCVVAHYIGTFSKDAIDKQEENELVKAVQAERFFPNLKYTNYRPTKSGKIEVYVSDKETPFTRII